MGSRLAFLDVQVNEPAPVLDYAPGPPARWRRILSTLHWFVVRRRIRAAEIVIGGWLLMVALYALPNLLSLEDFQKVLLNSSYLTVAGATIVAFCTLLAKLRWRAVLLAIVIAVPTGVVGGLVQTDRCPHARYVNIGGVIFTVSGKACHNGRYFKPWWRR